MPPPIDPNALVPVPQKRTGLLGGLQRFGGLLGRNFDRNALGGIDATIGKDEFTNDMRRAARANAVMSIGQMLATQGKVGIQEGLKSGQEKILGAWKLGRDRRQEDEGNKLLKGGMMGQPPVTARQPLSTTGTSAEPPGAFLQKDYQPQTKQAPTLLDQLHQQYADAMSEYRRLQGSSYKPVVEARNKALDIALETRKQIVELSKMAGSAVEGVDPATGKPIMGAANAMGAFAPFQGIAPTPKTQVVNTGPKQNLMNLTTGELIGNGLDNAEDPTAKAKRLQDQSQFLQKLVLDSIQTNTNLQTMLNNRKGDVERLGISQGQLAVAQGQLNLARHKQKWEEGEAANKPMSADSSKTAAASLALMDHLPRLKKILQERGAEAVDEIVSGRNQDLAKLAKDTADLVGRMRSGGAISKDESEHFLSLIASWRDSWKFGSPPSSFSSLDDLLNEAATTHQGLDPKGTMKSSFDLRRAQMMFANEAREKALAAPPTPPGASPQTPAPQARVPVKIPKVTSVTRIP